MQKRQLSLSSLCIYIPSNRLRLTFWLTISSKIYVTFVLQWIVSYLVGMKIRTSRHVACKKVYFHFHLSLPKPKYCAGHNSHTVSDNLIIFGRDIYQVKLVCCMQEGQCFFVLFF